MGFVLCWQVKFMDQWAERVVPPDCVSANLWWAGSLRGVQYV